MDDQNLLAVIVTDGGLIKNQIIRVNESPSVEVLSGINKILNQRLVHLSIEEINLEVINNLKLDLHGYDEVFNAMLPALYQCLKEDDTSRVFMEGTTNIFNYPEYNDIEKAKQILSLLHNKDCVVELIEPESDITIKIGDENYIPEAKDCSVISAEYSLGDSAKGTIGLIGPRRINYSKVIAIMAQVMKELNNTLRGSSKK